jgi:hypothetical protein
MASTPTPATMSATDGSFPGSPLAKEQSLSVGKRLLQDCRSDYRAKLAPVTGTNSLPLSTYTMIFWVALSTITNPSSPPPAPIVIIVTPGCALSIDACAGRSLLASKITAITTAVIVKTAIHIEADLFIGILLRRALALL